MTTTMLVHRRATPLRRLGRDNGLASARSAALAAWRHHATLVAEGTSLEEGRRNRQRLARTRRVRRLLRSLATPLLVGLAVAGGLAAGRLGESTRAVPTIAPTRQPVYREVNSASVVPLALVPATHGTSR